MIRMFKKTGSAPQAKTEVRAWFARYFAPSSGLTAAVSTQPFRSYWQGRKKLVCFFDADWYLAQHPSVEGDADLLRHYLEVGEAAGFSPNRRFDPIWYRGQYPDVDASRMGALKHFIKVGLKEGRAPQSRHPDLARLFDEDWYLASFPKEKKPTGDLLNHYLYSGEAWHHSPRKFFDNEHYLAQFPELTANDDITPLEHFLLIGHTQGVSPSKAFDLAFYFKAYPEAVQSETNGLLHFLAVGSKQGHLPRHNVPDLRDVFDPLYYRHQLPPGEAPPAGEEFEHYLKWGHQKYNPNPMFDTLWYLKRHPELKDQQINPLQHYLHDGESAGEPPSEKFDPAWYWDRNRDVLAAGISPMAHYLAHGAAEKRMPKRPRFFTNASELRTYLSACPAHLKPWPSLIELGVSSLAEQATLPEGASFCTEVYASADVALESLAPLSYPQAAQVFQLRGPWVVAGTRYVISETNCFIHDESAHFFEEDHAREKYPLATKRRSAGSVQIEVGLRQGAWVGTAIHLMHEYDNNYFHFLSETATRLQLIDEAGIDPSVPLLIASDLHANLLDLLDRLNVSRRPICRLERGTVYRVDNLFYPTDRTVVVDAYEGGPFARKSGLDVARIARAVRSVLSTSPDAPAGDKIFAIRHSRIRALINQTEIGERLVALGFKIVDASAMDLNEQIQAFRAASVVVAPTGAQLTNIVWCRPGTQVWVLASDHPSHQLYLWELLGRVSGAVVSNLLGPRANTITGLHGVHDDFHMDIPLIVSALAPAG